MNQPISLNKISSITIAAVFLIIITVPYIDLQKPFIWRPVINENRKPADKPLFTFKSLKDMAGYFREYEKFVNDHIVVKPYSVKIISMLDYYVFGKPSNPKVIFGKDNWFYFAGEDEAFNKKQPLLTEEIASGLVAKVEAFYERCRKENRMLYFFIAPNKQTVYPEFLKEPHASWVKENPGNYYFLNREFLKKNGVYYIDTLAALEKVKSSGRIAYLKTDSHWNHNAVLAVYELLINRMKQNGTLSADFRIPHTRQIDMDYSGDLISNFLSLNGLVTEKFHCMDIRYPEISPIALDSLKIKDSAFIMRNPQAVQKQKILFVRDSQSISVFPLLNRDFTEVISLNVWDFKNNIDGFLSTYNPDIILVECVERMAVGFIDTQM